MLVRTPALVISKLKYGEADIIARIFSRELGMHSYMVKGVLKSRKGKLRIAQFQPLTQVFLESNHKNKGSLEYLKNLQVDYPYETIDRDIYKSSIVMFFSELLTQLLNEQPADVELFDYLQNVFKYLDQTDHISNFSIKVLLDLTGYFGFQPQGELSGSYFNLIDGTFDDDGLQPHHSTDVEAVFLKSFIGMNFDEVEQIKMNREERSRLLNLLIDYFQIHLHAFKKPSSLDILKQLFDR